MIKYVFCVTYGSHWFESTAALYDAGIAQPTLWLGDKMSEKKAFERFGDVVLNMEEIVHHPYHLQKIDYSGENNDFFESDYYLRAKDRCIKMMDRLDIYGTFSRIDRESYFHNLCVFFLKNIFQTKPDLFLASENPHSHAQYLLFEICSYLKIPTYKFNNWVLNPLVFLEDIRTGKRLELKNVKHSRGLISKIHQSIDSYFSELIKKKEKYEIYYMKKQRLENTFSYKIVSFYQLQLPNLYKDLKHNIGNKLKKRKSYINPYGLNFYTRRKIQKKRMINLIGNYKKSIQKMDYTQKYVYYPLHYEHERTTNPDGGDFQDQFLVLQKLRRIVPTEIQIVVKEHPSQFFFKERGSRGRSPLFYNNVNNIKNLKIISTDENTIRLILNAELVATVTGTVALESSILGKKALYFGNPWYRGLPNTFDIRDNLTYSKMMNQPMVSVEGVKTFLERLFLEHSIPVYINYSQKEYFKKEYDPLISSEITVYLNLVYKQFFNEFKRCH